jgi:tRNA threonylcarbamoyladenosine biosynthesis protein TsaB
VLDSTGLGPEDLESIMFAAGPGSFTGLRLAAAVCQGLGFSWGKPLIPVSSLSVLAAAAHHQFNMVSGTIVVGVDALRGDMYTGVFRVEDGQRDVMIPDALLSTDEFLALAEEHSGECFVGSGKAWHEGRLAKLAPRTVQPGARYVLEAGSSGQPLPPEQVTPLYLRESVNWQKWQKKSAVGKV